jgi:hypothetical protein
MNPRQSRRHSRKQARGYYTAQRIRTTRNIVARLTRHLERHPDDKVAQTALRRR